MQLVSTFEPSILLNDGMAPLLDPALEFFNTPSFFLPSLFLPLAWGSTESIEAIKIPWGE